MSQEQLHRQFVRAAYGFYRSISQARVQDLDLIKCLDAFADELKSIVAESKAPEPAKPFSVADQIFTRVRVAYPESSISDSLLSRIIDIAGEVIESSEPSVLVRAYARAREVTDSQISTSVIRDIVDSTIDEVKKAEASFFGRSSDEPLVLERPGAQLTLERGERDWVVGLRSSNRPRSYMVLTPEMQRRLYEYLAKGRLNRGMLTRRIYARVRNERITAIPMEQLGHIISIALDEAGR